MSILEIFRKSPFQPLAEHMAKVRECVNLVRPMFEALRAEDYERLGQIAHDVFKTEHQADVIKNEVRRILPKRIFLPVHREDLLGYLKLQDDIADSAEDIAVLLTLKQLKIPPGLADEVMELVDKVLEVCERCDAATHELKNLVEVGFAGAKAEQVLALVEQAEHAEWESDKLEIALSRKFFAREDEIKPSDFLLWSRILTELGRLANHAEKTGDRLRRMLVR